MRRPTAAYSHPAAITIPALSGSRQPNTSAPAAPAAASKASPQYNSHWPMTAAGAGLEPSGALFEDAPKGRWTPMPKAKEPFVMCPSTFDTVRQLTVYTPLVRRGSAVRSSSELPGATAGLPTPGTARPAELSSETVDRLGSGASVKYRSMTWGERGSSPGGWIRPFQERVRGRGRSQDDEPGEHQDGHQRQRPRPPHSTFTACWPAPGRA